MIGLVVPLALRAHREVKGYEAKDAPRQRVTREQASKHYLPVLERYFEMLDAATAAGLRMGPP